MTDDASMVESLGHPVKMFPGYYENLKVTTPGDLVFIESFLESSLESSLNSSLGPFLESPPSNKIPGSDPLD
jgi:hypothetical protein